MKITGKDRTGFVAKGASYILMAVLWMFVGFYCRSASVIFWSGVIAILGVIECTIFLLWALDLGEYLREKRHKKTQGLVPFGNKRLYPISLLKKELGRYKCSHPDLEKFDA